MIHLSAFADEVSADINKQLLFLQTQGIQNIELRFVGDKNVVYLEKQEILKVKGLLERYRINCSAIASPIGKVPIGVDWHTHFDLFKKAVDCAILFGTKFIRIFSFYPEPGIPESQYKDQVVTRLLQLTEYVQGMDLTLVHENEKDIFGDTAIRCQLLAKEINSPNFKLVYDPGNFVWGQQITDPMQVCWPLMKNEVMHIHIKDWELGAINGSVPGKGDAQISELMDELKVIKYDGFISLEPHLEQGGQFGGYTSEALFGVSVKAIHQISKNKNIELK